jgi:hypothetical protein
MLWLIFTINKFLNFSNFSIFNLLTIKSNNHPNKLKHNKAKPLRIYEDEVPVLSTILSYGSWSTIIWE